MSDLTVSTTTDTADIAKLVADNKPQGARVPAPKPESQQLDGSSTVSWEHPESERQLLLQRLADEERDADRLINPEDETATIISNDPASEADESTEPVTVVPDYARPEHPHYARMQALHRWYGSTRIEEIARPVIDAGIDLAPGIAEQLASLENGPEVLLQLCKDPWAPSGIVELNEMSPSEAKRAIAQWSMAVAGEESEPAEQIPTPRSKPPAPIRPLGGSSTKSSVPPDEMTYREYRRYRDAEERNRYRR